MPLSRPAPQTAPGPSGEEMLRAFGAIRRDPLAFLASVQAEHGDVVQFPIPSPPTYLVTDPAAVRRILVTNAKAYGKRTLQYTTLSLVTGDGLLTADTEAWRPQRRLVQPAFHHESLELVATHVRDAVDRLVARWLPLDGTLVDVDSAMMRLALEVVGESLFGRDLTGDAERLADATVRALDVVIAKARNPLSPPMRVPTPANLVLRRAVRELDAAVDAMLSERATRPRATDQPPRDMLDLLLAAHDDDGGTLSRQQVRDEIVTFIVAGHETVASALTWAWHLVSRDADVAARLRAEADAVNLDAPVTEVLAQLPYAAAVLDETLRLYPPAWLVTRRAREPDELAGVAIAADALVIVSPWLVHRHPAHWPDPERFDPARFLEHSGARRRDVSANPAYLPFGAGPRQCIGRDLALVEGTLVLASLARRLRLRAVGLPPRPVPLVTVRPAGGLLLKLEMR